MTDVGDQAEARIEADAKIVEQQRLARVEREKSSVQLLDDQGLVVCDDCGFPIAPERLDVAPFATLCVPCKQAEELESKKYG